MADQPLASEGPVGVAGGQFSKLGLNSLKAPRL